MKANRKKILKQSLKLLLTGAIAAGSAGLGTLFVIKQNGTDGTGGPNFFNVGTQPEGTDLSTLNCTLADEFFDIPTDETLISTFATQNSLEFVNDLRVERNDPEATTVKITTIANSFYYKEGTYATVIWKPFTSKNWTSYYGSALVSHLAVFADTEVGRNELLKDLATYYPNLDVSQLYIDINEFDQTSKSANIRVVEGSLVYDTAIKGTVTAGFVQACDLSYNTSTITSTSTPASPTFKFKGTTISGSNAALTYAIYPSVGNPTAFETTKGTNYGKLTVTTNNLNFAGAMYTITGTYVEPQTNNTYVSRFQVLVTPFTYDSGWTSLSINTDYYQAQSANYINAYRVIGRYCTVSLAFKPKSTSANGQRLFTTPYTPSYISGGVSMAFPVQKENGGGSCIGECTLSTGSCIVWGISGTGFHGIYWTYIF